MDFAKLGPMRLVLAAMIIVSSGLAAGDDAQFNGRWDISVNGDSTRGRAWWLEVTGAGTDNLRGKFIGAPGGQLDEIPKLSIQDGELRFVFDKKYRHDPRNLQKGLYWARLEDGKLKGTFEIEGDPSTYLEWTGVRAPALPEKDDGTWKRGDPVTLFDGKDLTGWQSPQPGKLSSWVVKEGVLSNLPGAGDLVSEKKFFNFDLHVEYMIGPRSNSGIALRGRYEVQLFDDYGDPPTRHGNGAIFGRIAPKVNASRPAGEWQILDVRLIGRQVSVTLNTLKVIDKTTIEGLTAMAIDPNEGDPGPFVLQGDLGNVQFRKIVVYPLAKPH
jgi:hypothetical protein